MPQERRTILANIDTSIMPALSNAVRPVQLYDTGYLTNQTFVQQLKI